MCFLRRIRRKVENEQVSINEACRHVNIHPKQYRNWRKSLSAMKAAKNNKAKTLCTGPDSILKRIEGKLLEFIFAMREQGMAVTVAMVKIRALQEFKDLQLRERDLQLREFQQKSECAQDNIVRRFIKAHGLVFRMSTHQK